MNRVQRYTWEDAIIEAESAGVISAGAANTGLRLARVVNWEPTDNRPSGLYWANELAADVVGVSRATFYRNIKVLKRQGYLLEKGGNLLPAIPQSQDETRAAFTARMETLKSQYETHKSQDETSKSQNETAQSQNDNPYSEDIYSEDICSENEYSEEAAQPPARATKEAKKVSKNIELPLSQGTKGSATPHPSLSKDKDSQPSFDRKNDAGVVLEEETAEALHDRTLAELSGEALKWYKRQMASEPMELCFVRTKRRIARGMARRELEDRATVGG